VTQNVVCSRIAGPRFAGGHPPMLRVYRECQLLDGHSDRAYGGLGPILPATKPHPACSAVVRDMLLPRTIEEHPSAVKASSPHQ
jgi:hypothetical protein